MIQGYIINNTGKSKHIFKRTIYPGQKVSFSQIYASLGHSIPDDGNFVDWVSGRLPDGWEISVIEDNKSSITDERPYREVLTAIPEVVSGDNPDFDAAEEDDVPSLQYATPKAIDKLTARDIYNLRMKDNPKRVLKNVNSIHKLRRALSMCKSDSRKAVLTRLIQGRIRELNVTL